ncbi:four-carbon acid sugar kinase family protein [Azospirillum himalayense]|uniref:Four-carbon acid sugar kinase family protein n=1 Tax=Azospirillum himalayense TaxID=654847 RepID=A0ABW0G126_9PROT
MTAAHPPPRLGPRLGWYGDDFTGATDTLATLAKAGQRALLLLEIPDAERLAGLGPLDALGIAGASRTMDPESLRAELGPVGRFFAGLGVPVMHYKCCSTFDSAPQVGSIGAAVAALRPFFPNRFLPVVGGQPNIGRYCLFSTLFAAAGTGGTVHRIDRHPTMKAHPVTPMTEADLRLHLSAQGLEGMGALHYPDYGLDAGALDERLDQMVAGGASAILLDIARPADLAPVGRLIWERAQRSPLLAVGPSGVVQALATQWQRDGTVGDAPLAPAEGPVFVLAGSLSPVTRRQIAAASSFHRMPADAGALCRDDAYRERLRSEIAGLLGQGRNVLAWTAPAEGETPDTAQSAAIADATADFVATVARAVPLRRIGIAGGDTSSKAVKALGLWGLSYRTALSPGVTVSLTHSAHPPTDGVELMLKGGQMGSEDLFERLVHGG